EAMQEQNKKMKNEALPGSRLIPFIEKLKSRNAESWPHEDVLALAEAMSGYGVVDGRSSPEDRKGNSIFRSEIRLLKLR
ncbi:hypothetical protein BVRB_034460, partial [Beta vulgaris subsp. vulgaris]